MRKSPLAIAVILAVAGAVAFGLYQRQSPAPETAGGGAMVTVVVPELTGKQLIGAQAFAANCAKCHGENASGNRGLGPPLVHRIYEPSHHADFAIVRAVRQGVRSHHWGFGDMPPVEGLSDAELGAIIDYLRALQRANGIP